MMAEAIFPGEENEQFGKFFDTSSKAEPTPPFSPNTAKPNLGDPVPLDENINGGSNLVNEHIVKCFDQLTTKSSNIDDENEIEVQFRKKIRVGNHYQARIPKHLSDVGEYSSEDELLWDPFIIDAETVEKFLQRISSLTKLLIPMGNHLRDDEEALYVLQKNQHDVEAAFKILTGSSSGCPTQSPVWSEEECRNFEKGLLNFGKNFFLIQKYKVSTRQVGELVQFYYLWKKTERYDLFASRMRGGKKKYALNPGISDLMSRYLGTQSKVYENCEPDVQFLVADNRKNVAQSNPQY